MTAIISGVALVLGDDVNTDVLQPSRFFSLDPAVRAAGVLSGTAPHTANTIIVAGRNFGVGSSRESVIRGLREAGIVAVLAGSVSRIFHRNAINNGLPTFAGFRAGSPLNTGASLTIDLAARRVRAGAFAGEASFDALDPYMFSVLAAGGLLRYLRLE